MALCAGEQVTAAWAVADAPAPVPLAAEDPVDSVVVQNLAHDLRHELPVVGAVHARHVELRHRVLTHRLTVALDGEPVRVTPVDVPPRHVKLGRLDFADVYLPPAHRAPRPAQIMVSQGALLALQPAHPR